MQLRSKVLPSVELHPHWRVDLYMPELEGHVGNSGEAIQLEKGHCHIQIPKMELLLSLNHLGRDVRFLMRRTLHRGAVLQGSCVESCGPTLEECSSHAPVAEANAPAAQLLAASGADEVAAAPLRHSWWERQRQDYQESSLRSRQTVARRRPAGVWLYPPAEVPRDRQKHSSPPAAWQPLVHQIRGAVERLKSQLHRGKQEETA
ncbi:hypothetical protein COCSUDRAFT_63326 [Coccomyxa subellipsoidea C-169]|uniref:DUF7781 domain-containing protein n=1 Tax=Coccomyxa subellipsoidea (strain C-169) TaxID=574566 RepID=I0YZI4_COCSC|nr:hypothetical protein COCSUDRAFT_63326 [Coccomyxa subellipsoidea C-169]EIE23803.1 hypothetical protein COCSUDRAFT_63326 [Coccomyxa subellipsoidea C-169]|eukprot:XP_005648347.1 hypothetical protein COCSUDRAFT_63326 [Coccomyxa subellipsoidea C-169]